MDMTAATHPVPDRVVVIGAGMVGLSTAWFLQEHGVQVTVLDRTGVAAGSSWGNAGWLTPGVATPLPEPAVLRYGLRAAFSPSSPVYVPPSVKPALLRFLTGFVRHSTTRAWRSAMGHLAPLNDLSLESFDLLERGGVPADTRDAGSFLAAYRTEAERKTLLEEIQHIHAAGQDVEFEALTGDQARTIEPHLSEEIGAAILLRDQRFVDPGRYVHAIADSVSDRGGKIIDGATVSRLQDIGSGVVVTTAEGSVEQFDMAVVATGAWLGELARPFGVRNVVQAGRGYSFSVAIDRVPESPVYLPAQRVACTPIGDRLRIAGMMEFREPDAPLDRRRVQAIADAARPLLNGIDLADRQDEWVGSRPCTVDGLPLIGATGSPRVCVAGGHGMWGITHGPVTGRLLAQMMVTGTPTEHLRPFDPLRRH